MIIFIKVSSGLIGLSHPSLNGYWMVILTRMIIGKNIRNKVNDM
jgi:hypothetical protein